MKRRNPLNATLVISFVRNDDINQYIASVHEKKKPFKCNLCDSSFAQNDNLKVHIASVHEKEKYFKCTFCDSCFAEKGCLKIHIASVHEGKKETFQMQKL